MDQAQGMVQGQDTGASQSSPVTSSTPTSAPAPQASEERTFKQSEVSNLVSRAKHEAVEAYRRQQQEQPQYIEQKYGDTRPQGQQYQPPMQNESPDDRIRKLAAEEAQRQFDKVKQDALQQQQDAMAQRTVQNFWNKVLTGRNKYQDFDQAIGGINLSQYPSVVQIMAEAVDNADDVMYHLSKDEAKMANLQRLAEDARFQHIAVAEAKRLAQSLKENAEAAKVKLPNAPLDQLRPSNTGTDNGAMSVGDYRKKYKV